MADGIINKELGVSRDGVERFERVQPLAPGHYWRATQAVEGTKVKEGEVLLLLQVKHVNEKFHSVVLLDHPSRQGRYQSHLTFLVNDFLDAFQPAPEGEAVRAQEVAAIQDRAQQKQNELIALQANPQMLRALVDERVKPSAALGSPEAEAIKSGLPATYLMDRGQLRTDVGFALEKGLTESDVTAMYVVAEHESKRAEATANLLAERVSEISETIQKLSPYFAEKGAVAMAQTAEVREYAEEIMRGIASLDLYTGKGVTVETIKEGAPAPAGEPLTIMQRKLFLEEEIAVWMDVDEKFDFSEIDKVDQYLAERPDFRDQLLPAPRSVVSVAVRRRSLDYKNPWDNFKKNQVNKLVFLLVRNGENIHRVYSESPSHESALRLFPTHDEYDNLFMGLDGTRITYNDIQYADRHKAAEDKSLHYKRFLILLAGLDHRLKLFGEFYPGGEALTFISPEFQRRHFHFAHDGDYQRMLGKELPSLTSFMREKNAVLQSGSRVVVFYKDLIDHHTAPSAYSYSSRGNGYNQIADLDDEEVFKIVSRRDKDLVVDVAMRRNTWEEIAQREFKAKVIVASTDLKSVSDGVLCLDTVTHEELARYIYDRESRIDHLYYLRLFKHAHAHLKAEAVAAEPTISRLVQDVLDGELTDDPTEARGWVAEAITAWRVSNRGAQVPAPDDDAGLRAIRNQIHQRNQGGDLLEERVEALVAETGLIPLKLVLTGRNKPVLYVSVPDAERTPGLPWHWVKRLTLKNLKTKLGIEREGLAWLQDRETPDEVVLKTWSQLATWCQPVPAPVPAKQWIELHEALAAVPEQLPRLFDENGWEPGWFEEILSDFRRLSLGGSRNLVAPTAMLVPVGASYRNGVLRHVALQAQADHVLYQLGNAQQKAAVLSSLRRIYAKPEGRVQRMEEPLEWFLVAPSRQPASAMELVDLTSVGALRLPAGLEAASSYPDPADGNKPGPFRAQIKRSLEDALTHWVKAPAEGESMVLAGGVWDQAAHVARLPARIQPHEATPAPTLKPNQAADDGPSLG